MRLFLIFHTAFLLSIGLVFCANDTKDQDTQAHPGRFEFEEYETNNEDFDHHHGNRAGRRNGNAFGRRGGFGWERGNVGTNNRRWTGNGNGRRPRPQVIERRVIIRNGNRNGRGSNGRGYSNRYVGSRYRPGPAYPGNFVSKVLGGMFGRRGGSSYGRGGSWGGDYDVTGGYRRREGEDYDYEGGSGRGHWGHWHNRGPPPPPPPPPAPPLARRRPPPPFRRRVGGLERGNGRWRDSDDEEDEDVDFDHHLHE